LSILAFVIFHFASLLAIQEDAGTLTGRVATKDGKPAAGVTIRLFAASGGFGVRATGRPADADGRFRLENVPPGQYYVAANANDLVTYHPGVNDLALATTVEIRRGETAKVPDFALAGLKVRGRAVVDRKGPLPRTALTFTSGAGRTWATVLATGSDGTFEATLPEGEWRVAWDASYPLPSGYALKELRYGGQDGLRKPLSIRDGDRAELSLAFSAARGSWVKVEGRVKEIDPIARGYEVVLVSDTGGDPLKTDLRHDATFEFRQVLQGAYTLHLVSVGSVPFSQPLKVGNRNVSNVEVAPPRQTEVEGSALMEGEAGALILRFRLTRGAETMVIPTVTSVTDGSFKLALPEGEFQAALVGIPPEFIKEFRYGPANLLREPLRVAWGRDYELHLKLASGAQTGGLGADEPQAPRAETVIDGVRVRPASLLLQTTPHYSAEGRAAHIVGSVILETIVREDGTLAVVRALRGLGYGLDEQAIAAVEQWRFRPATQDGIPLAVQSLIEVVFRLR
jgi:TonB family protein